MSIQRFSVQYSSLIPSGSSCSSPTISWGNVSPSLTIPCYDDNSLDIEINTDIAGPYCLTFIVTCTGCSSCPPVYVEKCFCVDGGDCPGCSTCNDYVCVSTCPDGKICDNDTCVSCTSDDECPCDQVCNQGDCKCPSGKKKAPNGCCVECFDGEDLGNCRVCIGGEIIATTCPDGHCNPNTGDCQECLNNEHCSDEPNKCCIGGECDCCPGYVLDPVTNECVPAPPCTSAQDCWDTYGKCYTCTEDGCVPTVCPDGFVCNPANGECVPGCGNCPEGSGCINGMCIPCNELSCSGVGQLCQYATGCQCVGQACEYINCSQDTVDLAWVVTPGTPGQPVPGSGLPTLQGTTLITPTGLVILQPPASAAYMNHSFALSVTNGTSGNWTLYHDPSTTVSLGTGTSTTFDLEGTATGNGPNLIGFVVKFVETGTGRTATWAFYRNIGAPITASNVWNSEFTSTGTPPNSTGGTSGSIKLCSTNGNFTPTGVTNVVTTGSIMITFYPSGSNCLTAIISGCGTWSGDVILTCGGTTFTVPAPSFTKDPSNCCDPTDPNCDGWGQGEPCNGITTQNIELVALPTYGTNGDGDGEFIVYGDWTSAGLTFLQWFFLNPSDACWSSTGDFSIVTNSAQSPFGPSPSNLGVIATLGSEGCIRLGYTCDLLIGGCKKLQGEKCLTVCQSFFVDIVETGVNTYTAVVSNASATVNFEWVYPGLVNTTSQTVTITPVGGVSAITVHAYYGAPVRECTAYDSLGLNYQIPGCTNAAACNYMSTATVDDNSCVFPTNPTWDCTLGGFQGDTGDLTGWTYLGNPITRSTNFDPGTYTLVYRINGQDWCSRVMTVSQCYRCDSGVCIPAPVGENLGLYTSTDCGSACSCDIEINITQVCSNNRGALLITATGDTGTYTVTVNKVGGLQVLPPTSMTTSGSVSTPLLCNGVYRVLVQGANCNKSRDYSVTCGDCAATTAALTSISYDCATNQLFATIVADDCATSYTIQLRDELGNVDAIQTFISAGAKTIPLGVYPGDGVYGVRLFTSNGCIRTYPLSINCNGTLAPCPILSTSLDASPTGVGSLQLFTASIILDSAGGSYSVKLHPTTGGSPGSCSGAVPDTSIVLGSQAIVGAAGVNNIEFTQSVPTIACYAVVVQKTGTGFEGCNDTAFTLAAPGSVAPPVCSLLVSNISYDTTTGQLLLSWAGSNTSNDITIQVKTNGDNICVAGDPIVINSTGNGEDGLNIPFSGVSQIQGTTQCLTIDIFDTSESGCNDSTTYNLAGCTCAVTIVESSVVVDPDAETVAFDYTTRCTSGDLVFDVTGDATGSGSASTGSENGVVLTQSTVVSLSGYPSTGGSITIEVSDNVDGACIDTFEVELPQNCVSCGQIASIFNEGSVVTQVRDHSGNLVASGSLTADSAGEATFESTVEAGIISSGGNFCLEGDRSEVEYPRASGIRINQDSSDLVPLDHVLVTDAAFVGSLKSYFTDCGCSIGRLCDYTYSIAIAADTSDVTINYAEANVGTGFTGAYNFGITQTPSPSELSQIGSDFLSLLTNAACANTVEDVVATYDTGTDILTIEVLGTDAGVGIAFTQGGTPVYEDAVQTNCA